jgi:methylated-DNA-[protein]-cysteine S-methyltransferase
MYYQIIKVGREEIGLVWGYAGKKPRLEYIYLPNPKAKFAARFIKDFPEINKSQRNIPRGIDNRITKFYLGQKMNVDLPLLNLKRLSEFSAKVLKTTCKIPRGKVATYSGLAAKIGSPRAARAVGTALANNPFPIVIPCHRVVRADGTLGEFGGGSNMKRELLVKEGVAFDSKGRVSAKCIWQQNRSYTKLLSNISPT